MSIESERVDAAVLATQSCPKCGAVEGENCMNNSTSSYYPPHVKRYEMWVKNGRMHTRDIK